MTTGVPYPSKPYVQTHPDRLAVISRLFGLETASVAACRVLEAGCGDGLNLLAMASVLPNAEFVGIDLSASAIARGTELARQAGIRNVTLIAADLCDADAVQGKFDYIVAHGVYSWVPSQVRDALIDLCAQKLEQSGVAMISYATHPGGFVEQLVRAPMLIRAQQFAGEKEKVEAARAFSQLLTKHTPSNALRALYQEEWDKIAPSADGVLLHDQLSELYTPVYFSEFVRHAATHGLQYLGEANLGEADLGVVPEVRSLAAGDRIAAEQYLDLLRCRRFRQTILCRANAEILKAPEASRLRGCYAAAPPYLGSQTALPALEAGWPGFVPCDGLQADDAIFELFATGRIDVRTVPPPFDGKTAARPRATALARIQAVSDRPVTNLLHHNVNIEDQFTRTFLAMLDGRRTRTTLVAEIAKRSPSPEKVSQELGRILTMLGDHALLRQ